MNFADWFLHHLFGEHLDRARIERENLERDQHAAALHLRRIRDRNRRMAPIRAKAVELNPNFPNRPEGL